MARVRWLVDVPNARSSHKAPTPRGGGVGIVVAALLGWASFWSSGFASRPLGSPEIGLIAGAVIVALAGLADDWRAQPARIKLGAQALAAIIALASGLVIQRIALPILGPVELGWIGYPLTFLWLVGLTNAFNFMDGLDGLAGATALVAAIAIALAAIILRDNPSAAMAWCLAAGSAGFLLLNWSPARVFMGDVGSQFLGFAFAGLGVLLAASAPLATGALFVPLLLFHFLFDTALTTACRMARGAPIWQAHREHLYQRLNRIGIGHAGVALWLAAIGVINAMLALWLIAVAFEAPWWAFIPALWLQLVYGFIVMRRERHAASSGEPP
jgi:UDP-GlcNAc:undecaprenyl-phosphate GlcNAc-1-phosphate transferase